MSTRKLSDREFDKYVKNIMKSPEGNSFDGAAWSLMEEKLVSSAAGKPAMILSARNITIVALLMLFSLVSFRSDEEIYSAVTLLTENLKEFSTDSNETTEQEGVLESSVIRLENTGEFTTVKQENPENGDNYTATNSSGEGINIDKVSEEVERPEHGSKDSGSSLIASENRVKKVEFSSPTITNSEPSVNSSSSLVESKESAIDQNMLSEQSSSRSFSDSNIKKQVNSGVDASLFEKENGLSLAEETESNTIRIGTFDIESKKTEQSYSGLLGNIEITPYDEIEEVINPEERRRVRGFEIGLTVAPDLSVVGGIGEFDNPGWDIGLNLEYHFSDRISILTGVTRTKKIYRTTDAADYRVPEGFWTDGIVPDNIDANCTVIDIPLNLKYYFNNSNRNRFFVSGGISTYLFLWERYDYDYDNEYNSELVQSTEINNGDNHLLGVYNISFGYSHRFSDRLSFEAEPYFKRSLGRVGWGDVELGSTGIQFNVKYKLFKN